MSPEPEHEYFMGLALEEARRAASCGEVPVGAVLTTTDGIVLARAHNQPVSLRDPTAHAEILVLRRAASVLRNYRLPGTVLYVTLEPCPMCFGALMVARVDFLVFGARDPKSGAVGDVVDLTTVRSFHHSIQVLGGVRARECSRELERFFAERRSLKRHECGEVPKWS